eukprot:TRINITY_DN3065_c0_g1_i3.p1 TRINITY_DN3065_c0_g1~~TRINITY_DN3065_c0_g1_i3.p1  ORF type:complete len:172 (+),score=40.70 TRINITY_DN3065_c0_g1_i3:353-868(+)
MHRKDKKKKKKKDELEVQERVLDLLDKHMEQCEDLIEGRGGGTQLFDSSSSSDRVYTANDIGKLPDLDAPEFELLRINDQKIDEKLVQVYDAVTRIKEIQKMIGAEIDDQAPLIQKLGEKADDATEDMKKLNTKLGKTIKEVRSARDFCCDCCLFICILGVLGSIYFLVAN